MRIDLDKFFGPTATRSVEELADEERNGVAYLQCWNFHGDFPGFEFLKYCGDVTHINMHVRPVRSLEIDFSSVPLPSKVVHVHIDGGRQGRDRGQAIPLTGVHTVRGLNRLHNLKDLELLSFPALLFGDSSLPASLEKFAIVAPGKLDIPSLPDTAAGLIHLCGFHRRIAQDYGFISRFSGLEQLWLDYCSGLEIFPALHPDAPVKEVSISKASRLRNVEALVDKKEIEAVDFRFCPQLNTEALHCLRQLPKLKRIYVSDQKRAAEARSLFPQVEVIIERLSSG